MRILYLSFENPYLLPGIHKKELEFCKAMFDSCNEFKIHFKGIKIFFPVELKAHSLLSPSTEYLELKQIGYSLWNIVSKIFLIKNILQTRQIFQCAYNTISKYKPDVIIFRYKAFSISSVFNPKKVNSNIVFVSEHQSKEIDELKSFMKSIRRFALISERIRAKKYFNYVDAITGVTSEIAKYELERAKRNIPFYILSNGIDVNKYPVKRYQKFEGNTLKMICVVSKTMKWQGLDRLLLGMKNYQGDIRFELHIVGMITQEINELLNKLKLKSRVFCHGIKYGKELDSIYNDMHIAIGTLGIHRKNLEYGTPLKVREYIARGIPFLISYKDEDIDSNFPFFLKLAPDDSSLNMEQIIHFTQSIYQKYENKIPIILRNYAAKKLDYNVKTRNYLQFILNLKIINNSYQNVSEK
ncbi:MAG: hypothetical protein ACFFDN_03370 [Candidatus Hodarchaeota archaeon]